MTSEYRHIPVMLEEVMDGLALKEGAIFLDCTLGGAGHSVEAAKRISAQGLLIGLDQDDMALEAASKRLAENAPDTPVLLVKGNFGNLDALLTSAEVPYVDAILFDLGVSSPQLDIPERGFTYKVDDAPLDMRMDPSSQSITAAQIIATYSESELFRVLRDWGEEKWASRIARFIVQAREKEEIRTTGQLVEIIKAAIPASARRAGGHPAKQSFQALRIETNQEFSVLKNGLEAALRWLAPGGRIVVMSYHSLEDRITKEAFANLAKGCTCPPDLPICVCGNKPILKIVNRKPLVPDEAELERNPRSKSVKIRIAQKL